MYAIFYIRHQKSFFILLCKTVCSTTPARLVKACVSVTESKMLQPKASSTPATINTHTHPLIQYHRMCFACLFVRGSTNARYIVRP